MHVNCILLLCLWCAGLASMPADKNSSGAPQVLRLFRRGLRAARPANLGVLVNKIDIAEELVLDPQRAGHVELGPLARGDEVRSPPILGDGTFQRADKQRDKQALERVGLVVDLAVCQLCFLLPLPLSCEEPTPPTWT